MTVTSGQRLLASLPSCDRKLWWLKTLVASSAWHSTMCLLTWKHKVTPAGRSYYQLQVSVPRIDGSEFGWWPAPTAIDATLTAEMRQGQKGRHAVQLSHLANSGRIHDDRWWLLPTPDAGMVAGGRTLPPGTSATGITPDGKKRQVGLTNAVRMLPTPQHHDHHPGDPARVGRFGTKHGGRNLNDEAVPAKGMKLNPEWVCRMMGFPDDYLTLDGSATR